MCMCTPAVTSTTMREDVQDMASKGSLHSKPWAPEGLLLPIVAV